jgi:uncharacterized protein YfaS (alpha-2-macroglobulin family)
MKNFRRILVLVPVLIIGLMGWSGIFSSGGKTFTAAELNVKWKTIMDLEKKQQYNVAIPIVEEILVYAKGKTDAPLWTKALVRRVILENALHGYETSIRLLLDNPWPQETSSWALLNLYTANTLFNYYQNHSWEINRREKIGSQLPQDIKAWTGEDIFQSANEHFYQAWLQRDTLGREKISTFPDYIRVGNYPGKIRKTMRDFLVYQWVDFLQNTTTWQPQNLQEKYKLALAELLKIPSVKLSQKSGLKNESLQVNDPGFHPLEKITEILNEQYLWHRQESDPESAVEAMLIKIGCLTPHFTKANEKAEIAKAYREILQAWRGNSWWAHGQYQYAAFVQSQGDAVTAHQLAKAGYEQYPRSIGGLECLSLMKAIEAPAFSIQAMSNDRSQAPSIQITHSNVNRLYFRIFRMNIHFRENMNQNAFNFNNRDELVRWIFGKKPDYAWESPLEDPKDYQAHVTYEKVPVPEGEDGIYIIAVSANPGFDKTKNQVLVTTISISTLTMLINPRPLEKELEVWVRDGLHGEAVSGVKVTFYQLNDDSKKTGSLVATTDERGLARISTQSVNKIYYYNSLITATKGKQFTFYKNNIYPGEAIVAQVQHEAFVYTDRSIYRPLQKVYFKVIAYEGDASRNDYRVIPNQSLDIELVDPNGEVVAGQKSTTNNFGSCSGEFVIPRGRQLGPYTIRAAGWGQAEIRVEEYKRPTFEARLLPPDEALRLNNVARVKGEARYYFGMPVTEGTIRYRITREASYPWWYSWLYDWYTPRPAQEIVAGETALNPNGGFEIQFLPEGDEALPDKSGVSYRFRVSATITDSGGETKEARLDYAIGFVNIQADIQMAQDFYLSGENIDCSILRANLNGTGQAGRGNYQVFLLKQPEETLRAYEIPQITTREKVTYGDNMRPRWTAGEDLERTLFRWEDGLKVSEGQIVHNQAGQGKVTLAHLKPGVYRLRYVTIDPWGVQCQAQKEFIVVAEDLSIKTSHYLLAQKQQAYVGEVLPVILGTGFRNKQLIFETWLGDQLVKREFKTLDRKADLFSIPITAEMRGGFTLRLYLVEDYQIYKVEQNIDVPFSDKQLDVNFTTFRDRLQPGGKETWSLMVRGPGQEKVSAEILSYMHDRSLDYFIKHGYPNLANIYQRRSFRPELLDNVAVTYGEDMVNSPWFSLPERPILVDNQMFLFNSYPVGGPGGRKYKMLQSLNKADGGSRLTALPVKNDWAEKGESHTLKFDNTTAGVFPEQPDQPKEEPLRDNFAETAFFYPHLLTDEQGNVKIEFEAPDSVTSWNIYVHALTRDLKFMTLQKQAETRKELMVRPYLPRFFREGDEAVLKVVVNNAGKEALKGEATIEIYDPETNTSSLGDFKLEKKDQTKQWSVPAGQSTTLSWKLTAPDKIKTYAFKVMARSKDFSDGEVRPAPVLPGRMHLVQSRFATLKNDETLRLQIEDMVKAAADSSLRNEKLVVTLDGRFIDTVLRALPYLVNYPYECTEQTMNRFLSTSIVNSLYDQHPHLAKMSKDFSSRKTQVDPWALDDPNRKLTLEETPWLEASKGGRTEEVDLINMFDTRVVKANQEMALAKLRKAQRTDGGFPWFEGGPASDYMTVYILHGMAKAREFNVLVPEEMVRRAWKYVKAQYDKYHAREKDRDLSFLCFMNYVLSCFPESYYKDSFSQVERMSILSRCFKHWTEFNPYRKALLALTLQRAKRTQDAKLVLVSVMDSAKTTKDQGTFWAREDQSWLWYNDEIESHAFILRTLLEINPQNPKVDGLALWLLLNKKMNQWKSTRATAEAIYSLALYMKQTGSLAVREEAGVDLGGKRYPFVFEPDQYSGGRNQIIVEGEQVKPEQMAEVTVDKRGKGFMFASMTWHYSTEKLPTEGKGDVLSIKRSYFVRRNVNQQYVLEPLAEGAKIQVGDEIEVKISITCRNPMEYVHLHDPRAAGLEPERSVSGHRWDLGLYWYEEVRDSGVNFFFEQLPQGEYNFKYRLRANMAGRFRVGPATIESMYAPEFVAFSAGQVMEVGE